jgi:3-dehydroquinate synthase
LAKCADGGLGTDDGKNPFQVARAVIERMQVQRIDVASPEGVYPVFVGAGILARVGALIAGADSPATFSTRCAIVTQPRVREWYGARVIDSLRARGWEPRVIEFPEGEQFKTLDTLRSIYDQLIAARLDRHSVVCALGGGVVGDVAGLAAATYLRGVPFVQIPTTLLAMVDASIGGKVAVDHARGKNLIGAFKQPHAVIADLDTLATLPAAERRTGMAEVVKHAIIGDAGLFARLERGNWSLELGDWIARAIRVKVEIVARDPFERGERAKLNLGHTFAHAFETLSNYELRHGDAVAIGLVCAARLAARRGICPANLAARIENLLRAIGLPTRVPRDRSADAILGAMAVDKKRVEARLRFVLLRGLGDIVIVDDVTREEIVAVVEELRE